MKRFIPVLSLLFSANTNSFSGSDPGLKKGCILYSTNKIDLYNTELGNAHLQTHLKQSEFVQQIR